MTFIIFFDFCNKFICIFFILTVGDIIFCLLQCINISKIARNLSPWYAVPTYRQWFALAIADNSANISGEATRACSGCDRNLHEHLIT